MKTIQPPRPPLSEIFTPAVHDEVRETTISTLIFSGDRVWKMRKPVAYPFLDQRSLIEQRRLCEREVELNSRVSPGVYLGVVDIDDPTTGERRPATLMRRMPTARSLSTLISAGEDVHHDLREIARTMATFHLSADFGPRIAAAGQPNENAKRWHGVLTTLARFTGTVLDGSALDTVGCLADEYIAGRSGLFKHRIATDKIVDGHGDLLADDIFCLSGGPAILDCLEFSDELRYCDVLSDVASLVMDCERLGHGELGEYFLREYTTYTADSFPASLAHHYIAYRAAVRCEVACLRYEQGAADSAEQARILLGIALRHVVLARVTWILVGGPPGVGKSTVAGGIADALGWTLLRSDEVRGEVTAGGPPQASSKWLSGHFSTNNTSITYHEMIRRAERVVEMGESVILDATWNSVPLREMALQAAVNARCSHLALRCDAPADVAEHRVARRIAAGTDISLATVAIARRIYEAFDPWPGAVVIGTGQPIAEALTDAITAISAAGAQCPAQGGDQLPLGSSRPVRVATNQTRNAGGRRERSWPVPPSQLIDSDRQDTEACGIGPLQLRAVGRQLTRCSGNPAGAAYSEPHHPTS
jgi:aminoglycoside phosphotransferase family enzyme/predicted kinase